MPAWSITRKRYRSPAWKKPSGMTEPSTPIRGARYRGSVASASSTPTFEPRFQPATQRSWAPIVWLKVLTGPTALRWNRAASSGHSLAQDAHRPEHQHQDQDEEGEDVLVLRSDHVPGQDGQEA